MSYKIYLADPFIDDEEINLVSETLKSGWISQGPKTLEFEKKVASICGTDYAVAMCNGTATLHSALLAVGVNSQNNVICPSLSYISTSNAILYCGAKPNFVDIDPNTFNICPDCTELAIDKNTKAIIMVDLKGQPSNYDKFAEISKKYNIPLVADSAQSFAASYNNSKIGSQALIHSFSMFANKNITSGEGGVLTTNDYEIYQKLKYLRNQGQQGERYVHQELGFNYRYNDVLASIALSQIKRIDMILNKKQEIANTYNIAFKHIQNLKIPFIDPKVTQHSWYHYTLTFTSKQLRDKTRNILEDAGIETRVAFPPIHLQPMFNDSFKNLKLSNTLKAFETMLDIPCHAKMNENDVNLIIKLIRGSLI